MSKTKDAVTDFLELGAKYELILAGLFDDLTRLRADFDGVARQSQEAKELMGRAARGVDEARSAMSSVQEELRTLNTRMARQKTVNILLACSSVAAILVAFIN
jgi:hypothetical protein